MPEQTPASVTAFVGPRIAASGPLHEVAVALHAKGADGALVFSDATGSQVELDLRGDAEGVRARYAPPSAAQAAPAPERSRGRPRMGVVAREVTLLPEHWEWLSSQPGGASVALRKLVLEAMRAGGARDRMRRAQERSYRVMVALAGNRPGFEEAARALFANDLDRLRALVETWPRDIREHVLRLADPERT